MSWESKYVVCRPDEKSKQLEEVFNCDEIKKARYWLRYIAEVNDVLFTTPLHPKNGTESDLCYFSHKTDSGEVENDDLSWQQTFGTFEKPSNPKSAE